MANERFPAVKAGQSITEGRANREGKVLSRIARIHGGIDSIGHHSDSFIQMPGRGPKGFQGIATITEVVSSSVSRGTLRHYNFDDSEWVDLVNIWKIDTEGTGVSLSVGDRVVVFWDSQRGMLVPATGGSGGTILIRFEVLAAGPFLGALATECDYVTAEVLNVSCQGAGVDVGDEVNIWDPSRCQFNIPIEVLVGAHGWAISMTNITEGITDCLDERLAEGTCLWVVQSLCCTEEIYGV